MAYPKLDCKSALWPKYSLTAIRGAMIGQLIFEADGGFMRQKLIMRQTSKQHNMYYRTRRVGVELCPEMGSLWWR